MSVPGAPRQRQHRRVADSGDAGAFTTKEVALQIKASLDAYILAHEARHSNEAEADHRSRSDPLSTASGRQLLTAIAAVREDLTDHEREAVAWREKDQQATAKQMGDLSTSVASHERTIQRLVGAMALIVFLGGGAFIMAALAFIVRLSGINL